MKKLFKIISLFAIFGLLLSPSLALAQSSGGGSGFVPCGTSTDSEGNIENPCGFDDLIVLINKIINFIFIQLSVPIAAIMFAYAGFLMMFSGGNPGQRAKAKKIFINVAIGLIVIAGSWLIIHTVSEILGYDGSWIGF